MDHEIQDIQLACFSLGENLFAVDIMRIKEIILPQKLSRFPSSSQLLQVVINLLLDVIPLMDILKRFGMPASADGNSGKLLIVYLAHQVLALSVDNVMEVITVSSRDIKPPLDIAEGIGMEDLLGVFLGDGRVFMLLDIDALVDKQEHHTE